MPLATLSRILVWSKIYDNRCADYKRYVLCESNCNGACHARGCVHEIYASVLTPILVRLSALKIIDPQNITNA